MSSDVPDHCRVYALKDPTDRNYQSQCSHEHRRTQCDKYDNFTKTIDDITAAIEALAADELKEELRFVMGRAKQDIVSWIALLLRSVNKKKSKIGHSECTRRHFRSFSSGLSYEVPSAKV